MAWWRIRPWSCFLLSGGREPPRVQVLKSCPASRLLSAISAHQLGTGEDVTAHRAIQLCSCRTGWQLEPLVERIQREGVAMFRSRRRTRTAVPYASEIVTPLPRTGRQLAIRRNTFWQFTFGRGQIVDHPVDPCPARCIGVIQYERKALCGFRRSIPTEHWRRVGSVACEFRGDVARRLERRRRQLQCRRMTRATRTVC